jgi:protein TonB
MTESTARAERFDVQTSPSPQYLWEVPQKPVSVRIPFSLIDRLEREAVESFRSLTSRGSEIGGLLVGDVAPGSPLVVSIADYELIACDYSRGPLYRLSDADLGRFEQAIQQRLGAGHGVAGFFRSHTRKGISLDGDDLAFFQARFRDPHHIALLVRPFATKASTAGIFIWENGKVNGEASCLEFPFRSGELGAGHVPAPLEPKAPAPSAAPPPAARLTTRAQIVPIASRREIPLPAAPVAEPAPPPAPVAAPPAPAATVAPAAAVVEEKTAIVPDKAAKADKPVRNDKSDKSDKDKYDKTAKAEKAAKSEPAVKIATPAKAEQAETLPALAVPEFAVPAARSGKAVKLMVAAAASIALFVALFVYPGLLRNNSKSPTAVRQDSSQLQLRVERAAGELLLTWSPEAEAIRNASKAVLSITDGDQHENVDMDLAQLASGRIVYSPSGTDIRFVMQVLDKAQKQTTSESVRMLRPPSPLQEQNAGPAKTAAVDTSAKPLPGAVPPGATAPVAGEQPPVEQPPVKPAAAPLKPFQTESLSQRLRPAAPTDMADAPTQSAGDRPTTAAIPGVNMNVLAPGPAAPPAASFAADSKPRSGGQIQQAVLIYRKDADYPKMAKQTGAKGVVKLNATIGTDGSIKKVTVISGHPMLTGAAVDAVKQWRYRPTMLNGQAVEAETQVLVNFVGDR